MMTLTGRLLGALVLVGLLGGCSTVAPVMNSEQAKDPRISTDPDNKAPKATIFPDQGK